jgi:DNA polymerase III gamma/tau subunit
MLEARRACLDELAEALCEGRAERLLRADHLAKDTEKLPELLEYWLGWWRDLLLVQSGDGDRITNVDREDRVREQAAHLSPAQVQKALKAVRETAQYLSQNVNARLSVEVLLLRLPQLVI